MESVAYDNIFTIEENLWWYRGRRAVCLALLEANLTGPQKILDVGCGTGYNMRLLERFGEVHGVDFASEALDYCRGRGLTRVHQADATRLPFEDASFDLVTAFDVIEHIADDRAALTEFRRVLKPGGQLLIYTPALPWLYGEHDRIVHHQRRYRKAELQEKIVASGFGLTHCSYVNLFILPIVLAARALLALLPRRPHAEMSIPPAPFNRLFSWLCGLEVPRVIHSGLPYGMTLVALARKARQQD